MPLLEVNTLSLERVEQAHSAWNKKRGCHLEMMEMWSADKEKMRGKSKVVVISVCVPTAERIQTESCPSDVVADTDLSN